MWVLSRRILTVRGYVMLLNPFISKYSVTVQYQQYYLMVTYQNLLDNARGITSTGYASYMCLLIDDQVTRR